MWPATAGAEGSSGTTLGRETLLVEGSDTGAGVGGAAEADIRAGASTAALVDADGTGVGAGSGELAEAVALPPPPSLTTTALLEGSNLKSWVDFRSNTMRVVGGLDENNPARIPFTSPLFPGNECNWGPGTASGK